MQRLDRILAVIDPTVDVQVGAAKAARLARLSGASLELFACDFDPALTGQPFFDTDSLRRLREEFIAERAAYLEELAEELQAGGLDVATHVHWDNPLYEGILRRVAEFEPDLVIKDTHYHSFLRRALFTNTDWNLIRRCPVPLLLSRTADWPAQPRILAALDPGHRLVPAHRELAALARTPVVHHARHVVPPEIDHLRLARAARDHALEKAYVRGQPVEVRGADAILRGLGAQVGEAALQGVGLRCVRSGEPDRQ